MSENALIYSVTVLLKSGARCSADSVKEKNGRF